MQVDFVFFLLFAICLLTFHDLFNSSKCDSAKPQPARVRLSTIIYFIIYIANVGSASINVGVSACACKCVNTHVLIPYPTIS